MREQETCYACGGVGEYWDLDPFCRDHLSERLVMCHTCGGSGFELPKRHRINDPDRVMEMARAGLQKFVDEDLRS